MKLSDLLAPAGIRVGVNAAELVEVLRVLLAGLGPEAVPLPPRREKFARDLAFGSVGEVVRLTPDVVAVVAPREAPADVEAMLAIGAGEFAVTGEGRAQPGSARAVFLFLTGTRPSLVRNRMLPVLAAYLKKGERARALVGASTADQVLALPGLLELKMDETLKVEAALTPVSYRVYPDTPLDEVVDLMIRRELHAVPVVGEGYEVMGIITTGDALRDLVPRRRGGGKKKETDGPEGVLEGLQARDIMTRTVMCVSEDQPLVDAASLMVNRDVEQLPVVREGELVGFLTRDAVLRVLFGR